MTSLQLQVPDQADYLAHVAGTDAGAAYKRRMLELLDVRPGSAVLDAGCGPATDLVALAELVGSGGRVTGLDRDVRMAALARARTADRADITVSVGDLHDLPFEDGRFERARTDRVLQHVEDPARALAELRRVLVPGGRLVLGEPDWDSFVVDHRDATLARAYTRHITEQVVRNAGIGHQLPRLVAEAGFVVQRVEPVTVLFDDLAAADPVLGLARNTARAVEAGYLAAEEGAAFLDGLGAGPFYAAVNLYLIVGDRQP